MAGTTKENGRKIRGMGREKCYSKMDKPTGEAGQRGNNMARGRYHKMMVLLSKVNG
jgi:hypothetical protein